MEIRPVRPTRLGAGEQERVVLLNQTNLSRNRNPPPSKRHSHQKTPGKHSRGRGLQTNFRRSL